MSVINSNGTSRSTGFEFGPSEPLTVRLRGLIRSYPKGAGIIKEYIQNADDAGARQVKIILDCRSHPSDNLPGAEMKQLMGPAILVFNDKGFTEADLKGIQRIGQGGDKGWDTFKTGRFGLGFNASYNVTDYPCFLTGNGIYFFDPHANAVTDASISSPGRAWNLNTQTWSEYKDMLRPFEVLGLQQGQCNYPHTVFRLPLRTKEQAQRSEICQEPFTHEDFTSITNELIALGSELLLFLKHVIHLEISKISSYGSEPQPILTITTDNPDEVIDNRTTLNRALLADPEDMLDRLKKETEQLPSVAYQHRIRATQANNETYQTWQVISGLFVDTYREILDGMEAMLKAGEKALPWAGAATLINSNGTQQSGKRCDFQGKLYCFLPLPQFTGLPVHLNAFFDIDSSRQGPTSDESLIGKDQSRVKWNQLLIEHSLSQAYAGLITVLAEEIGRTDPAAFYEYWPNPNTNSLPLLKNLSAQVFSKLEEKPVLRSASETTWISSQEVAVVPDAWMTLQKPLAVDQRPIPDPELPPRIISGFATASITLKKLTPRQVRSWLRVNKTTNVSLEDVERSCLRQRDWIETLLSFCLSDGQTTDLRGVPLALLANGKLNTFGYFESETVYLAPLSLQAIFSDFPGWFIEQKFAEATELSAIPNLGLEEMGPSQMIEKLNLVLSLEQQEMPSSWNPDGEKYPNAAWLTDVYTYLAECGGTEYKLSPVDGSNLKTLPLVPDQFGRLHQMGKAETPLLPAEQSKTKLVDALTQLDIPVVSGPDFLMNSVRAFTEEYASHFIWPLTAVPDFIDTLDAYSDQWTTKMTRYIKSLHDPILNHLAEADDLKDHPEQIDKFRSLPILPTLDNQLVSASTKNIYIPVGEEPPVTSETVTLLQTGPRGRWITLFQALSIPELDLPNIILDVLLPVYPTLPDEEKYRTLTYIRDNLSKAATKLEDSSAGARTIWDKVAAAPLISCTDGKYHPAKKAYHPANEQVVRNVLGQEAPIPDMSHYKDNETWLKFFSSLGMTQTLRPMDLIAYINKLIDLAETEGVDSVTAELLNVFGHIRNHWTDLTGEENSAVNENHTSNPFVLKLKQKAWLPAQRDEKSLRRYPGYNIPENRLYKPEQLYMPRHGHLVASQKPIARLPGREPDRNMRQALGFLESPEENIVMAHFDRLLELWHSENHAGLSTKDVERSLGQIYSYFGNLLHDETTLAEIRTHYKDTPSLWNPLQQKFWPPHHVFNTAVPYFEPRRTYIHIKQPNDDQGYIALGRREAPSIENFIEFLEDIAEEFGAEPLGESETDQVLRVLFLLGQDLKAQGQNRPDLRVLTSDNFLIKASHVYEADAPWYVEKLGDDSPIYLLHGRVTRDVIEVAEIPSLSERVVEKIVDQPTPTSDEPARKWCQTWQENLQSSEFNTGLIRLMSHFQKPYRTSDLDWLADTRVIAVDNIKTELSVDGTDLGIGNAEYYFDPGTQETSCTIFLAKQQQRLMELFLANALNQQLDQAHLDDLSQLTTILGVPTEKIDDMLTKLRVQKPQDAPPTELTSDTQDGDEAGGFEFPSDDEYTPTETQSTETDTPQSKQQTNTDQEQTLTKSGQADQTEDQEEPYQSKQSKQTDQSSTDQDQRNKKPGHAKGKTDRKPKSDRRPKPQRKANSGDKSEDKDKKPRSRSTPPKERPHGLSYVKPANENKRGTGDGGGFSDPDDPEIYKIERVAVDIALAYEYTEGRRPVEKERTNKGYDIESYEADSAALILNMPGQETLARIIEVKGTKRPWDNYGVYLTPAELDEAKQRGDQYFLYVVEYALHPTHRKLYIIQNPAQKIKEYRFDKGWKRKEFIQDLVNDTGQLLHEGNRIKDAVNAANRAMVKWYNEARGFGVLDADDYLPDGLFFHISEVKGHNSVQVGDVFEFEIGQRRKGKGPCAVNLRRI
ncbi:MAG: DUF3883 domain-containing protein [Anaerolineae bacterium]|nr:DUF3883 domain-containing protein [Anaerolineae bacterium]